MWDLFCRWIKKGSLEINKKSDRTNCRFNEYYVYFLPPLLAFPFGPVPSQIPVPVPVLVMAP